MIIFSIVYFSETTLRTGSEESTLRTAEGRTFSNTEPAGAVSESAPSLPVTEAGADSTTMFPLNGSVSETMSPLEAATLDSFPDLLSFSSTQRIQMRST